MPQLDATTFTPQIIWLVITFGVLYALMARVALPRIAEVLEARSERITEDLELAEKLRDEASAALEAYEASLAGARNEAHGLASEARDKAAERAAKRGAEHEAKLAADLGEAEGRIAAARDRALADIRGVAVEAAQAATAKLIGVEVDAESMARAVDDAFREGE